MSRVSQWTAIALTVIGLLGYATTVDQTSQENPQCVGAFGRQVCVGL